MRLTSRQCEQLAGFDPVHSAGNRNVRFTCEVESKRIVWSRMLAQSLPRIKCERGDRTCGLLYQSAAYNGAGLERNQINGVDRAIELRRVGLIL
jgi:hypothetical protein